MMVSYSSSSVASADVAVVIVGGTRACATEPDGPGIGIGTGGGGEIADGGVQERRSCHQRRYRTGSIPPSAPRPTLRPHRVATVVGR